MARYKLITLIDITKSNASRSETDKIKIGQQANFNSLVQAIGLRSNLEWDFEPAIETGRLPEPITGKANHWVWEFYTERDHLFELAGDPIGQLIKDFDAVPFISGLDESMDQNYAVFVTDGPARNIVFHQK
jgi:hypothetical protein